MKPLVFLLLVSSVVWGQDFSVQGPSDYPHDRNPREMAASMKRDHNWKFSALTVTTAAVAGIDAYQTSTGWRESGEGWLYGTHPAAHKSQLAVTVGAEVIVSTLASRWLRHRNSRFWTLPQSAVAQAHTRGMIHNFKKGVY